MVRFETMRFGALVMLVSWVALAGCARQAPPEEEETFPVTNPVRQDRELTKEYVAQVRAIQHIEVRALEKGYLQAVLVDEGQRVETGKPMFQLLPVVYQAEVQRAQAEAQLSEIELANTRLLAEKNVVSPNALSLSVAKVAKAKADVALAQTHRSLTLIHAPFSGIVGRFQMRLGSLVSEGDLITTLSDNSKVWVYFNVSEAEYLRYAERALLSAADTSTKRVQLIMADGETFDQPGEVETIEADFNNGTGNLAFRATFENPKGLLRHGETGKIVMTSTVRNALVIPQKATFDVLDQKFVYVVDEQGVVHSRLVKVSAELPHVFLVESGVDAKDRILIDGIRKVRDGERVKVTLSDPAEVLGHLDVRAE